MGEPAVKKMKNDLTLDSACVNNIRCLSIEMVQKANSGHPGAPMGCAPMAYALFNKVMNFAPTEPKWMNRDRFILSNGHACALQYSMLHMTGYARPTLDDIKQFRQLGSVTAGHPENHLLDGVEISTGPLGQGISNAVGLAIGQSHLAATYNTEEFELFNNFTYVICGDGCLQEGVSCEAGSLAGHLKLGKLIVLYDDNNITIDGHTDVSFTEDVKMRYEAYGWQVLEVSDGDNTNVSSLMEAIELAKQCTDKPSMIKVKTTIGKGAKLQGTAKVHGAPLGWDDIKNVRKEFGLDPETHFTVPEEVYAEMDKKVQGKKLVADWNTLFTAYAAKHPEQAVEITRRFNGDMPANWEDAIPTWTTSDKTLASRQSSAIVLNAVADNFPELIGGSADLTGSNLTALKCSGDYQAKTPEGRYLRFGVREHAMASVCNGLAAYGGFIPFGATFLTFIGYALGAMRLSALCELRVLYVMTHDCVLLGEDGPTHQPVESLATLRAIPNMFLFRPADSNEVAGSYIEAMKLKKSPSTFALSRQGLPNLERSSKNKVQFGGYTVFSSEAAPEVILAASGSEVALCIEAAKKLAEEGVKANVVSMPCFELLEKQGQEYKKTLFPEGVPVLGVECAGRLGWGRWSHAQVCMEGFGASGPGPQVYKHFGFTAENVAAKAKLLHAKLGGKANWLVDPAF